jgi:hypothetical protein
MPALSPVEKESVGLRGSRMGTKENEIAKAGRPEILINVKAGRVN